MSYSGSARRGLLTVETAVDVLSEKAANKIVEVRLRLEGDDATVQLSARVARVVSAAVANASGLSPGVGLELVDVADASRRLFEAFVERVDQRARRALC